MKNELAKKLMNFKPETALLGFDGFIDEVVHVVKLRHSPTEYERMDTLKEYGAFIAAGSGLSSNVEIVTIQKKIGGNGPIMANALKKLGLNIMYVGSIGDGAYDEVYASFMDGMKVVGIAEPGRTDAMEFHDGKLIRSKLDSLNKVCWQDVTDRISAEELADMCNECSMLGFVNWSLMANMSGIYEGLLRDVVPLIKDRGGKKVFFDLADPEKHTKQKVLEALELIGGFTREGFDAVLGLNKKEACEIAEMLGMKVADYKSQELKELAGFLFEKINVCTLVIHPVDRACCISAAGYAEQAGPYCEKPKLTTGAGDNFNAGYMLGYLNGCSPSECLVLGNAASGYYVREAKSAGKEELAGFLREWEDGSVT